MKQKTKVALIFVILGSIAAYLLLKPKVGADRKPDAGVESVSKFQQLEASDLPNCFKVSDGIYSGGQPNGTNGFVQLSRMGIRTVISVDGARPDVQLAEKFGLRYVHLPHGYDGIDEHHAIKLAKAIANFDGPIYIHCHHGKHRSPVAAAVACIGLGLITPEDGQQFLREAGTSVHYKGLYRSVARAKTIAKKELDQLEFDFPAISPPSPLVESMVWAEKHFDALVRFDANNWMPLADHPDLDAAHEALLLREQFAEMQRTETSHTPDYDRLLNRSKQSSQKLHELLTSSRQVGSRQISMKAHNLVNSIKQDCRNCHRQFRD